jgi:DNA-binding transcriptional regulator YiaG
MTAKTPAKKSKPPDMSPDDYDDALRKLGLDSHVDAAALLFVDERTSRRWSAGERGVPGPARAFLQYLISTGKPGHRAMAILGLKPE